MDASGSGESAGRVQRVGRGHQRVWPKSPKGNGAASRAMVGPRRRSSRLKPKESGTTTSVDDGISCESSLCGQSTNNKEALERGVDSVSSQPQHDVESEPAKLGPSNLLPGTVHNKTISPSNDETTTVHHKSIWSLTSVQATGGTIDAPKATVKILSADGEEKIACSDGTGLVNAAYKAVNQIIKIPNVVREYTTSVTGIIDTVATTRVVVDVTADASNKIALHALTGKSFSGSGASRDIVVSSVTAYLNALNEIFISISDP